MQVKVIELITKLSKQKSLETKENTKLLEEQHLTLCGKNTTDEFNVCKRRILKDTRHAED